MRSATFRAWAEASHTLRPIWLAKERGAEQLFEHHLRRLRDRGFRRWRAEATGRTVTLKMKYTDFQIFSRAKTVDSPIASKEEFAAIGRALLEEVLPLPMPIRLMGLTLSKLEREGGEEPKRPDTQLSLL